MDTEALASARNIAARYLGYSARSRTEIARRLSREDFTPDIIEAVIAEMEAMGWVDDAKFANDWVGDRADRKHYGRTRLAAELQRRGVDRDTASEALDTLDEESELRRALEVARSRWKLEPGHAVDRAALEAEKRKMAGFLQRRGFGWPIITKVFHALTQNQE